MPRAYWQIFSKTPGGVSRRQTDVFAGCCACTEKGRNTAASGIKKKVTPHVLRHCFATHLLECGVDIAVIQALLGHGSLRATEVYTHVSVEHIGRVKSPLDLLGTPAAKPLG